MKSDSQIVAALAVITVLGLIGIGLIVAGILTKQWGEVSGGIGTIIGSLATALNTPTGVANALKASSGPKDPPTSPVAAPEGQ